MSFKLLSFNGSLYPIDAIDEEELDRFNEIANMEESENEVDRGAGSKHHQFRENINKLRDHHHKIKDSYERLDRLTARGPNSRDFIEPKVQGLWRVALNSNFTPDELSSIKSELHHYESRLLKLRNLHAEHALHREKYKVTFYLGENDRNGFNVFFSSTFFQGSKDKDKSNRFEELEEHIHKQTKKVAKLHDTIEERIFKQHTEL